MNFLNLHRRARQEVQGLFEIDAGPGKFAEPSTRRSRCSTVRLRRIIPQPWSVYGVEGAGDQLTPEYVNGEDFHLFSSLRIPLGQGLSGWVAESGQHIINGNPSVEPGYLNDPTKLEHAALRAGNSAGEWRPESPAYLRFTTSSGMRSAGTICAFCWHSPQARSDHRECAAVPAGGDTATTDVLT